MEPGGGVKGCCDGERWFPACVSTERLFMNFYEKDWNLMRESYNIKKELNMKIRAQIMLVKNLEEKIQVGK